LALAAPIAILWLTDAFFMLAKQPIIDYITASFGLGIKGFVKNGKLTLLSAVNYVFVLSSVLYSLSNIFPSVCLPLRWT